MSNAGTDSLSPPRHRHRTKREVIPRRHTTSPHSPYYNRIIRLEGQITSIISILKFHLRYADFPTDTSLSALRLHPLPVYFDIIQELNNHIECGLDYNGAFNAGDLIYLAQEWYFPHVKRRVGADGEVEVEVSPQPHWPKILFLAQLQRILEDETLSLAQSLKAGWEWFMDLDVFPSLPGGMREWALGWHELPAVKQKEFLRLFDVDAKVLGGTMDAVGTMSLRGPLTLEREQVGCVTTFLAQDRPLDAVVPLMLNPSKQNLGSCSLCGTTLRKQDIGSEKPHRPVEIPCGHIFGSECIVSHFRKQEGWTCPFCGWNLFDAPHHPVTPKEVLESCDRILKYLDPPASVTFSASPHSYLEKLGIVFEDADAVRVRFDYWLNVPYAAYVELLTLFDLALYLARDRLDAAVRGDIIEFRDVVGKQFQVEARIQWLEFLRSCHPKSPVVW